MPIKKFILLLLLITPWHLALASNESGDIASIDSKLTKLKNDLFHTKSKQSELESQLQQTETAIGNINIKIHKSNQQLQKEQALLDEVKRQHREYQTKLSRQQNQLAEQLRAAYMMGHQEYLKTLLNQQNPEMMSRTLTYFKYYNESRVTLIHELEDTLTKIQQSEADIKRHTDNLQALKTRQEKQKHRLEQDEQYRKTLLTKIKHSITTKSQQIAALQGNKRQLQHIVNELKLQRRAITVPPIPIGQLKGQLPLPTLGKVSHHFGNAVDESSLKWNGILIDAPNGEDVYAIYPGKVIFADWLKGFGLLLIIDHGDNYMTLYGRNQSLYAQVGDHVKAGDLIAKVGHSGGYSESGLYFEIRRNGSPLDPERWCNAKKSLSHA
ncbi:MAG: hypothetical protein CMF50_02265 [Legionellales bacterium]|nr:hypothetical protein [Legionellales bacterium]|tara:strand:+ start:22096 stop:23241 length:1146 start_codon:yes stop_codon:yes gene_type:complete